MASVEVSAVVGNRLGGWENQRRDGTAAHLAAGRRAAGLPRAARAAELPPPLPARLPSPRPAHALPLADPHRRGPQRRAYASRRRQAERARGGEAAGRLRGGMERGRGGGGGEGERGRRRGQGFGFGLGEGGGGDRLGGGRG